MAHDGVATTQPRKLFDRDLSQVSSASAPVDWVRVSEYHYSPRILTPSLPIAAACIASHTRNIKVALLGPIVPQSNPVLLAEEMAMLDTMAEGRLIVGMLRGITNEMLT